MPRDAYTITIEGTGKHHEGSTDDADYLAARLAIELKDKGHDVTSASFSPGAPDLQVGGGALHAEDQLGVERPVEVVVEPEAESDPFADPL